MLASSLPANPSLEQLRKQAKEVRDLVRTGNPEFTDTVRRLHPRLAGAPTPPLCGPASPRPTRSWSSPAGTASPVGAGCAST
jgi:hypothetical protein